MSENKEYNGRKYKTYEEYKQANKEKVKARSIAKTEYMKQLRKEGRGGQLELADKLARNAYEKDWIDFLIKNLEKYEVKEEGMPACSINTNEK